MLLLSRTTDVRLTTKCISVLCIASLLAMVEIPLHSGVAIADGCNEYPSFGNIAGSQDTAVISGRGALRCDSGVTNISAQAPQPYYTHQIVCSTDGVQALDGVCSPTPCSSSFFALRTLHHPDGTSTPAGFQCVTLTQATPTPGLTTADVYAAIRRVKLPGGEIGAVPHLRGLANLPSYFFVRGATQPPVDLQVGSAVVHAQFQVVEYQWAFGDGQHLVTTDPGRQGLDSQVRAAYGRRGRYRVGVTVVWTAQAFLAGRRVGQVDQLVSQAQTTYPVAEVHTILTG
jgi:hypothetical protein